MIRTITIEKQFVSVSSDTFDQALQKASVLNALGYTVHFEAFSHNIVIVGEKLTW